MKTLLTVYIDITFKNSYQQFMLNNHNEVNFHCHKVGNSRLSYLVR